MDWKTERQQLKTRPTPIHTTLKKKNSLLSRLKNLRGENVPRLAVDLLKEDMSKFESEIHSILTKMQLNNDEDIHNRIRLTNPIHINSIVVDSWTTLAVFYELNLIHKEIDFERVFSYFKTLKNDDKIEFILYLSRYDEFVEVDWIEQIVPDDTNNIKYEEITRIYNVENKMEYQYEDLCDFKENEFSFYFVPKCEIECILTDEVIAKIVELVESKKNGTNKNSYDAVNNDSTNGVNKNIYGVIGNDSKIGNDSIFSLIMNGVRSCINDHKPKNIEIERFNNSLKAVYKDYSYEWKIEDKAHLCDILPANKITERLPIECVGRIYKNKPFKGNAALVRSEVVKSRIEEMSLKDLQDYLDEVNGDLSVLENVGRLFLYYKKTNKMMRNVINNLKGLEKYVYNKLMGKVLGVKQLNYETILIEILKKNIEQWPTNFYDFLKHNENILILLLHRPYLFKDVTAVIKNFKIDDKMKRLYLKSIDRVDIAAVLRKLIKRDEIMQLLDSINNETAKLELICDLETNDKIQCLRKIGKNAETVNYCWNNAIHFKW